jgi:hypothetical protein
MIPPSSQSPENEEATLKPESAGGFPTPQVGPFTEAANVDSSEPGAKGHAYSPYCLERLSGKSLEGSGACVFDDPQGGESALLGPVLSTRGSSEGSLS